MAGRLVFACTPARAAAIVVAMQDRTAELAEAAERFLARASLPPVGGTGQWRVVRALGWASEMLRLCAWQPGGVHGRSRRGQYGRRCCCARSGSQRPSRCRRAAWCGLGRWAVALPGAGPWHATTSRGLMVCCIAPDHCYPLRRTQAEDVASLCAAIRQFRHDQLANGGEVQGKAASWW